jgi:hypothetical protein
MQSLQERAGPISCHDEHCATYRLSCKQALTAALSKNSAYLFSWSSRSASMYSARRTCPAMSLLFEGLQTRPVRHGYRSRDRVITNDMQSQHALTGPVTRYAHEHARVQATQSACMVKHFSDLLLGYKLPTCSKHDAEGFCSRAQQCSDGGP